MKKLIKNTFIAGIFFFIGFVFCLIWGRCRIGKLQMYIDPKGNGTILLEDDHLVGHAANNVNSFDVLFRDSGFRFCFFHSAPDLGFQSIDFNGDGIPERIFIENGNKDAVENLVRAIAIESCSP